ncbi:acyl-CoA dehydrogenase family protein [Ornithinibacillus halophilus]|uniref:Acyl-CoA dehydrogenase n=1 Tax=Ornithinibacillus halophilus TaxID=930117 RepID=A0A1M5J5G3_9BACI|nr:acyl-CoA dehydrogenase family protein [Ornithinibacillus halophilus]SHG35450.1 Acyl-CoA dehydrogenase [Ornithinibacillus halophilus]
MKLLELSTHEERLDLLKQVVKPFLERADKHDKEISFPFDNFQDLKEIGYPAVTIPKQYGGLGISLSELLQFQEVIAKADGSTALAIGWHMGLVKHIGENHSWKEDQYRKLVQDIMEKGSLINAAATEPATGSPTRGGRPETTARKENGKWIISGRKTFTTLAPTLDYIIVRASIEGTDKVGNFLVKHNLKGVKIVETWDSIAMRATGSHDLVLEQVELEENDFLEELQGGKAPATGWLLHIPACYNGIAKAAKEYATHFATTYSPNSMEGTISTIPSVQQKIGEMELLTMQNDQFLYGVAAKWDQSDYETRQKMQSELGAAKYTIVNQAVKIVDLAMRIVGARSLSEKNPLQRYYRDVRAGIHNPPMDDMIITQLAKKAINEIEN